MQTGSNGKLSPTPMRRVIARTGRHLPFPTPPCWQVRRVVARGTACAVYRRTHVSILRGVLHQPPRRVSIRPHDSRWYLQGVQSGLQSRIHSCISGTLLTIGLRHEGALRHRSLDLKEATTAARYPAVQNGTQGMHIPAPFRYTFRYTVTYRGPFLSFCSTSYPCFALALLSFAFGEAGKRHPARHMLHASSARCMAT